MSCRLAVVIALVGCSAIDAPLVELGGRATIAMTLDPGAPPVDGASTRWKLATRPAGSTAELPADHGSITFVPDLRGVYIVELWTVDGISDDLARRFEIRVEGMPPVPTIQTEPSAAIGAPVTADGSPSASAEGRSLSFAWRILTRPRDSSVQLSNVAGVATSFVPDLAGDYTLELSVFDGELWSSRAATATITAR